MIKLYEYWCLVTILTIQNLHSINAQVTSNASEPTSTAASTNPTTSSSESEDNKDVENSSPSRESTTESSPEVEPLNKYRRDGLDAEYLDRWEDDKKRYLLESYGNQFEDDYYPSRERARFNDRTFPFFRIQGCPHYSRDVSRDDGIIRSGILQGWLGAAKAPGTRNNDDKRLEMSPFYMTTATPKTAPSYRNHANGNKPYADYETNYEKQSASYGPNKAKYYGKYRVKGSASKDYYNLQGGNYANERNVNSWQFPSQAAKNNRVVYYEYNLEDSRRPENGYPSSDHYTNYNQCDIDYADNSRRNSKNNYYFDGNRHQLQTNYGGVGPQSRYSTNVNQEANERELGEYYSDDGYQNGNVERADRRSPGYEFNLPLHSANNDKANFPPVIPPTLSSPRTQFMAESGSLVRDKNAPKSVPFSGRRFHFQSNNFM